jgi:hypothetical protein
MTLTCEWSGNAVSINENQKRGRKASIIGRARYQEFKASMAWALRAEVMRLRWQPLHDYLLRIEVRLPPLMDIDAVEKAAIDALQVAGVIENDRHCQGKTIVPIGTGRPALIRWIVSAAELQTSAK